MDAYKRDVGARLLEMREAKGLSQEDAAHAVGATTSSWGRWERGEVLPQHYWRKIADAFDVDVAYVRGKPPSPLGLGADGNGESELDRRLNALQDAIEALAIDTAQRDLEVIRRLDALQPPPEEFRRRRPQ